MAKKFEELDIRDWFIFGRVMEDPDLCHDFLSTLLQENIGRLTTIVREKELRVMVDGKTIRLDICATEDAVSIYNAEMQNLSAKKTIESLHLPHRSRAYQSLIDCDVLDRGMKFKDLPDVNIVFICTFDPFGKGKYLYLFENTCEGDAGLKLGDRARRFFFNATARTPDIPEEIRTLFEYIMNRETEDDLTRRIEDAVERVKGNSVERSRYKDMVFPDDLLLEAEDMGWRAGIEHMITDALLRGKSCEEIAEFNNLPLEEVQAVEKKVLDHHGN